MHAGLARRSPGWRAWIVILAVALVGAASVATVWHGDHAGDQDCAVCQLRHQREPEGVWDDGTGGAQHRGDQRRQIEMALTGGAHDAGEHLLSLTGWTRQSPGMQEP